MRTQKTSHFWAPGEDVSFIVAAFRIMSENSPFEYNRNKSPTIILFSVNALSILPENNRAFLYGGIEMS